MGKIQWAALHSPGSQTVGYIKRMGKGNEENEERCWIETDQTALLKRREVKLNLNCCASPPDGIETMKATDRDGDRRH